eukprot:XP_017451541.1 PREDICTED: uncharacterized protein LOC108351723 isoform X2 [Rattus norvegicus]
MAARPSTAASRPPVLEKRLGREVAEGGSPSSPPLDHLFHPDARRGSSDEGEIAVFPPTRTRAPRRPPAGCTLARTPSHPYPHTREHTHR